MARRKIKMGMVGGGQGAFIGAVHRMAAALDGQIELVCGAFSSNAEKSKLSGEELFLPPERVYGTYDEMISSEMALPEGERMDIVSVVTPNFLHFDPTVKALKNGFHVILDKPMTFDLEQALELQQIVKETGLVFALTHTYTGYPMVKQAREMIRDQELGNIRKIYVEYPQGWLSTKLEDTGQKQADWRTDPDRSGKGGCLGDIGTHAANIAEYVSGLKITSLLSNVNVVVDGRLLDDDVDILVRYNNGASGTISASQVLAGAENGLKIVVHGEKGGIEWRHREPNSLIVRKVGQPEQTIRAGAEFEYLSSSAKKHCRTPSGHPEGFIEAFANIYRNFALTVRSKIFGEDLDPDFNDFPGIEEGVRGMTFIENAITSTQKGNQWVDFNY